VSTRFERTIYVATVLILIVVLAVLLLGTRRCEARGGAYVRTAFGMTCLVRQ